MPLNWTEIAIGEQKIPLYSGNTVIVGSGAAALNAALQLHRRGVHEIAVVTDCWGAGTSNNAGSDKQTYYKLAIAGDRTDSPRQMAEDLYQGGSTHGDIALCEAQHSLQAFYNLVDLGVPFPHDTYGGYPGYRTDHDQRGRATSAGPGTSREMFKYLGAAVKDAGIQIFDKHQAISLITRTADQTASVCGLIAMEIGEEGEDAATGKYAVFNTTNVILATGGPGGLFKTSVYPENQSGSMGLGFSCGAIAQNLTEFQYGLASIVFRWNLSGSYQQVIPRYLSTDQDGNDEREFLIESFPDLKTLSGAIFLKGYEWPFDGRKIENYGSSLIDLLVYRETAEKNRRVFLDYTKNTGGQAFRVDQLGDEAKQYLTRSKALGATPIDRLKAMNPAAAEVFAGREIDLTIDRLEIAVCAQHCNGGFTGNIWWESNIRHLFPVGEVNGTHGTRRPGGSALNAGQVGGIRAALYIAKHCKDDPPTEVPFLQVAEAQIAHVIATARQMNGGRPEGARNPREVIDEIQTRMSRCAGPVRNPEDIASAREEAWNLVQKLERDLTASSPNQISEGFRAKDLALTHAVVLEAIHEYIHKGGQSRGGFLISQSEGAGPSDPPGPGYRFSFNGPASPVENEILEISVGPQDRAHTKWIAIRPIPQPDDWYESVWDDFRAGRVIR